MHPHSREVYVTLTNGSGNSAPVNSGRDPNPYGHIVRFREALNDDTAFAWDVFLLAGDPGLRPDACPPTSRSSVRRTASGSMTTASSGSRPTSPTRRRTWRAAATTNIGNNPMLAANPVTGEVKRFLTGPRGCEITGVTMTPDQRTMFVNIQHPGESTTYWNNQFGAPSPAASVAGQQLALRDHCGSAPSPPPGDRGDPQARWWSHRILATAADGGLEGPVVRLGWLGCGPACFRG